MRSKSINKKVLVILGPTASGKSDLAVKLALKYNGEVISADSRQVYKGLDIGTGKITKKETRGVPHHLLDISSPKKVVSVVAWKELAEKAVEDILSRGKLPIICGGTGFYIQSIVDNIVYPDVLPNKILREKLNKKTTDELVKLLKKLDPKRLRSIDQKNRVRLIRAIEIAKELGVVPKIKKVKPKYEFIQIGIKTNDAELKEKIQKRLVSRMKKGMVQEAKNLHKKGLSWKRMRELGLEYRYLADYLENKINKQELNECIVSGNWQYAKRQITWFKRDERIKWFDVKNTGKVISFLGGVL